VKNRTWRGFYQQFPVTANSLASLSRKGLSITLLTFNNFEIADFG
jgi:hypothetical protein